MGIIYKLIVGDYFYIGKTTKPFKERYYHHHFSCFYERCKVDIKSKIYYKNNKESRTVYNDKIKIYECSICETNKMTKHHLNSHYKTKKHINIKKDYDRVMSLD